MKLYRIITESLGVLINLKISISGLAPQKAVDSVYSDWATGNVMHRKIVYNGSYYFAFYWNGPIDKYLKYVYSVDGKSWSLPVNLIEFSKGPCGNQDAGGNVDIYMFDSTNFYLDGIGSNEEINYPRRVLVSGSTLTLSFLNSFSVGNVKCVGGNCLFSPDGKMFYVKHGRHTVSLEDYIELNTPLDSYFAYWKEPQNVIPPKSISSGGFQCLPYKTSSPYDCIVILKDSDNALYYSIIDYTTKSVTLPFISMNLTLTSGFNSFSCTSEAQDIDDPERVHLVYIKSSGELCYRKFESNAWSNEFILVESGATYPVIATGNNGKLYVFYVLNCKIWVIYFSGVSFSEPVELFTTEHTYNNPTYLSTNQNIQNGKICLIWTEGTSLPYEVWFSYIESMELKPTSKSVYKAFIELLKVSDTKSKIKNLYRIFIDKLIIKSKSYRLLNWFRRLFKYKDKEHPRQKENRT